MLHKLHRGALPQKPRVLGHVWHSSFNEKINLDLAFSMEQLHQWS